MNTPFVFAFAPLPIEPEKSPLAQASKLMRRRQSSAKGYPKPFAEQEGVIDSDAVKADELS